MVSSFFYLKYPGHDPWAHWLSYLLGAGCCCDWGACCMAGAGPGFICVLFCLQIIVKINILNSIINKSTLSFCRKSL